MNKLVNSAQYGFRLFGFQTILHKYFFFSCEIWWL